MKVPFVAVPLRPLVPSVIGHGCDGITGRAGTDLAGDRVGIAFTTQARLVEVMGVNQPWIHLDERAMRAMFGVTRIHGDPGVVAPGPPIPMAV